MAAAKVSLAVQLKPVGSFVAETNEVTGFATRKGSEFQASKVTLKIDSLKSGIELRDEHMINDYFEAKKFPFAEVVGARAANGKFKARMKMRGIERPISGRYTVSGNQLEASFKSKLSDWKIKKASYMGVGVVDQVAVTVLIPIK